jgi:carbon-monoxide dehydrogenase medium subunit
MAEFLAGPYTSTLADDELLAWIEIPRPRPGSRFGFYEFALRHGDYARAGAICRLDDGRPARAVLFAIASTPVDVSAALDPAVTDWVEAARSAVPPGENARLGRTVLARAFREAVA